MNSPLRRRHLRELRSEIGKYLVTLILLVASIGFVSGFLVADNSMIIAYNEGFTKYNVENGHFETASEMTRTQKRRVEENGVTLYELSYAEQTVRKVSSDAQTEEGTSTLRIYADRTEVNTVCLMQGELPQAQDEIAIDRMYADNNGIEVGDTIEVLKSGTDTSASAVSEATYKVTGLVALPDYSCLFEDNNDTMFDAVQFGVAVMSPDVFADQFKEDQLSFVYAWKYDEEPADDMEEKEMSDAFLENLGRIVTLEDYIPRYLNQAIIFTGDDMGSDKAMMIVLLYMVMAILAFVFGINISDTITKEANVIGTLRASGYTRRELIRHYMVMPALVTAIGAVIGNILGYTVLKDVCAGMYYGSYSLPTYVTVWNAEAFLLTTVVPILMMLVITYCVLRRKLRLSPLQFLRRDTRGAGKKRAIHLSTRISIMTRFRLRVILQNMSNYVVLFLGILFANLLLMFGMGMHPILAEFQANVENNLLSNYQYFLSFPDANIDETNLIGNLLTLMTYEDHLKTENPDAEKFSAYSLVAVDGPKEDEKITFYGIQKDSRYIPLTLETGDVYISRAYADKFGLEIGDTISLREQYEQKVYSFEVTGIYEYTAALNVFMPMRDLNDAFGLGDGTFVGYFSDTPITDIKDKYIGTVIDADALTKVSRQLEVSMGEMMILVEGFAVLIFVVVLYLLSKIIIEKNAGSISMAKILGYSDREIQGLYIQSTTIVTVFCLAISLPIEVYGLQIIWRLMMSSMMSGWLPFYMAPEVPVKMFLIGCASYAVVALYEFRKIKRVPMDMALKNVE